MQLHTHPQQKCAHSLHRLRDPRPQTRAHLRLHTQTHVPHLSAPRNSGASPAFYPHCHPGKQPMGEFLLLYLSQISRDRGIKGNSCPACQGPVDLGTCVSVGGLPGNALLTHLQNRLQTCRHLVQPG